MRASLEKLASLKLTVALLALGIVLVVCATVDQVNLGLWEVQRLYFRSFLTLGHLPFTRIVVPLPGGYVVGGLLLANLLAAQALRLTFTWRNLGLHLVHFGLVLLLVGELVTGLLSVESEMTLDTGATRGYLEEKFGRELAVVDVTDAAVDRVWSVPVERLGGAAPIVLPGAPLTVVPRQFFGNAQPFSRTEAPNAPASGATAGTGTQIVLQSLAVEHDPDKDNPAALVELRAADASLGVWLVSLAFGQPQTFAHAGRIYTLALRRTRIPLDFSLTLLEFRHDKYPGTDIPRNFSSRVRLASADGKETREVRISMNNPLRHGGYAFYQAGYQNNDRTSVLQVMRNPGWLLPYVACVMAAVGLGWHFWLSLADFIRRRKQPAGAPPPSVAAAPGGVR